VIDVLPIFRQSGALHEGHFRLSSGLHSSGYLQCALVLQHPVYAESLGRMLGDALRDLNPTVVLSPALGGLIIGHEVARALGVRAIFAERQEGVLTLRRGFSLSNDDRVVVIEDVVTTGGSTRETMVVALAAGASGGSLFSVNPFEPGQTMTAAMAALATGSDQVAGDNAAFQSLFFVGLLLFLITLVLNVVGDAFVRRVRQTY